MKKLYKIALRLAAVERSTGMGMRVGKWFIKSLTGAFLAYAFNIFLGFLFCFFGGAKKLNVSAKVFTALRTAPLNEGKSYVTKGQ